MCHQVKTIAKNCQGQLSYCETCKIYHLTFNNIYIELSEMERVLDIDYTLFLN